MQQHANHKVKCVYVPYVCDNYILLNLCALVLIYSGATSWRQDSRPAGTSMPNFSVRKLCRRIWCARALNIEDAAVALRERGCGQLD